jgi:hypothetical protein
MPVPACIVSSTRSGHPPPCGIVVVGNGSVVVGGGKVVVGCRVVVGGCVVVGGNVLVGATVVLVLVEVVVMGHGQRSVTSSPTAFFRHVSASLAVVAPEASTSQMHAGSHVSAPTAARKMKRQSDAAGVSPVVTG